MCSFCECVCATHPDDWFDVSHLPTTPLESVQEDLVIGDQRSESSAEEVWKKKDKARKQGVNEDSRCEYTSNTQIFCTMILSGIQ